MFVFVEMKQEEAKAIAAWEYEGMYSFYNMAEDKEDLEEFLSAKMRGKRYFSVYREKKLIGFFSYTKQEGQLYIGLGLKPDFTGEGLGLSFVQAGMQYGREQFGIDTFSLDVATFNERAIQVYKKAGFVPAQTFLQKTNGSEYEFLRMISR